MIGAPAQRVKRASRQRLQDLRRTGRHHDERSSSTQGFWGESFVVSWDAQHPSPFCTGGQETVPYEQKTQQSPTRGRRSAWHSLHSWKKRHASVGIVIDSRCPQ